MGVLGGVRPHVQTVGKAALVLALCAVAYNFSLSTLISGLSAQTPLAYLGLVPFIVVLLCALRASPELPEPDVHDRYLDYIIGLPLLTAAVAMVTIVPARDSTFFWLWRLDLLSLPLFVAGALAMILGTRTLARLLMPVGFLFLAWPPPYIFVVDRFLSAFTLATLAAVRWCLQWIPVASPVPGPDGSLFALTHAGRSFVVSVASVCAGASSLLAFVLVGIAVMVVVRGRLLGRSLWLASGLLVTWLVALIRILAIFGAGRAWGETFALDSLHPVIGLLLFNLAVLGMVMALPWFGLHLRWPRPRPEVRRPRTTPVRWLRHLPVGMGLVTGLAVLAGAANLQLGNYELLANDLGRPRVAPFTLAQGFVAGWAVTQTARYPWVVDYFGSDASWDRYQYSWQSSSPSDVSLRSRTPITVDVITTSDLESFSRYGIEACYTVHGYQIAATQRVALGGGLIGYATTYQNPSLPGEWTAVFWEWPVQTGAGLRYQRVVVNYVDPGSQSFSAPAVRASPFSDITLQIADVLGGAQHGRALSSEEVGAQGFAVSFARQLVQAASEQVPGGEF